MKIIKYILFISTISYFINLNIFHTESFILLIAFLSIFTLFYSIKPVVKNKATQETKEKFKWIEMIRFYYIMRIWYTLLIRESDFKLYSLSKFAIELIKDQKKFIRRNIELFKKREALELKSLVFKRFQNKKTNK